MSREDLNRLRAATWSSVSAGLARPHLAGPSASLVGLDELRYLTTCPLCVIARVDAEQPVPTPVVRPHCASENHADTAAINLELRIDGVG